MCKTIWFRAAAVACSLLVATGCTTQQVVQQNDRLSRLAKIAILVDSSVTHQRTMGEPYLTIAENDIISNSIGTLTENKLRTKGYATMAPVRTIGMTAPPQVEVDYGKTTPPVTDNPESPPFLISPPDSRISGDDMRNLYAKLNDTKGSSLPETANPFGDVPVVLVSARGYFSDSGTAAPGALTSGNSRMATGMSVGESGLDIDYRETGQDHMALTIRLYDAGTGDLLWQDDAQDTVGAVENTFDEEIRMMLEKLPDHSQ